MVYKKHSKSHSIIGHKADHIKTIDLRRLGVKQGFMTRGRKSSSYLTPEAIEEFKYEYGKPPIDITSKAVKQKIFKALQNDPRFRRVHYKYNTVLLNFKVKGKKHEFWKGGSYTISPSGTITFAVYVSPRRSRSRLKFQQKSRMKILFKDVKEFIDYIYTELNYLYKRALNEGFHSESPTKKEVK